jgi:hypothetical protein
MIPCFTKMLSRLPLACLLLFPVCLFAQPKISIDQPRMSQAVTGVTIANISGYSIGNMHQTILRLPKTNELIGTKTTYDFSRSGGGSQTDLVYFNDRQPVYLSSVTNDASGITYKAIEEVHVLKATQNGTMWGKDPTSGVISTLRYNTAARKYEPAEIQQTWKPTWQPDYWAGSGKVIDNSKWLNDIESKFALGTSITTGKEKYKGYDLNVEYKYKPLENYDQVQTETAQFKDLNGTVRMDVYREYYRDGFMYEEKTYYDCSGKPEFFESGVYDEYGDEWEYTKVYYHDGMPVAGRKEVWLDYEEEAPNFTLYYNPITGAFEDDPLPGTQSYINAMEAAKVISRYTLKAECRMDYPTDVIFVGPSLILEDYNNDEKLKMFGGNVNYTHFFHRKVGATVDIGYNWKEVDPVKYTKFNLLAGVTLVPCDKLALNDNFTLSVHALGGLQWLKAKYDMGNDQDAEKAFTIDVGPRFDWRIGDNIFLGIGGAYNPVFGDFKTANNWKVNAGVRFDTNLFAIRF